MTDNKIFIKPIKELLDNIFFIPDYQRGYRWTKEQVEDLLNDINEFTSTDGKKWYCLQPVVVKKRENKFEVIDGQQRLTTIYLILYYLNNKIPFQFKYETRDASFLTKIDAKTEEDSKENIDFFHIYNAYQTILECFKDKQKDSFLSKFNDSTKVIWYEVSENENSIDIFTRINSGKIPLTNAELIKALFLNSSNFLPNEDSEKLRLKQLEIASEWDKIEYALQDDSFWYFINKNENNLATRIEFIFNLEDKQSDDKYSTFRFFNKKFENKSENKVNENWQKIKKDFQTLEEWFNDRELYHKIGYLITIGINIKDIFKEKKQKSKTEFLKWINKQIQSKFEKVNLEEVEYNKVNVREILLLHNIQTMLNNENETNRFSFDRYKKEHWDVEHIHAIATKVAVKKENQVEWLKNNFIKTENHQDNNKNTQIEQMIDLKNTIDENQFDDIVDYVLGEEDNNIQNLCLLDRSTNRSYKNDSFKAKRKKIIQREKEGTFIPICTKNVFMKYYTDDVKDIEVWNEDDRKSYFEDIQKVIKQYLPQLTKTENEL